MPWGRFWAGQLCLYNTLLEWRVNTDNRTFEVRAPLSSEERTFQALKDHLGFRSNFMYSFCSVLPFSLASWLSPMNKMICVQWPWSSNLCFNSCPRRTVDISGRWSAEVSCKYLKVFVKASPNFLGWFCSNVFLYRSWLQIKCQLMNCNNTLSLQIPAPPTPSFDLKTSTTQ